MVTTGCKDFYYTVFTCLGSPIRLRKLITQNNSSCHHMRNIHHFLVPSSRLLRRSGYVGFGCLTRLFDLVVLADDTGVSGTV